MTAQPNPTQEAAWSPEDWARADKATILARCEWSAQQAWKALQGPQTPSSLAWAKSYVYWREEVERVRMEVEGG